MEIICPIHQTPLVESGDNYGSFICREKGCTVKLYRGSTSTPADKATRVLRTQCHEMMDVFWKNGFVKRADLYRKLNKELGKEIHIGQLNEEECRKVLKFVTELRIKINEIIRKEFE